jgi:hypothetical protein
MRKFIEFWKALALIPMDGTAGEDVMDLPHDRTTRTDGPDSVNVTRRNGDRTGITAVM